MTTDDDEIPETHAMLESVFGSTFLAHASWAFFPTAVLFFLTAALAVWFCIITLVDGD